MKAPKFFKMHGSIIDLGLSLLLMIKENFIRLDAWYTSIEGKDKLVPKLYSLFKHVGHWKWKVSMPNVDASYYSMNKNFVHSKMNTLLIKDLSWTYSSVIFSLSTNKNMPNLLLFITSLFTVVQWLILKVSKFYSRCPK